ncbi:hypothetical protein LCGC14_0883250 [marine sediment metagenome]|uniref:Sulfotransferase family protein n=1 Tax=marine sediment metagenome TaxID=412755 RepID=A0A0F9RKS9_9ZZZZ
MPRQIILHTGFHKTGTTSLTATLRANRPALKPHVAMRLAPQMRELISATRGYSTWRDPLSLIKAEIRFRALLDELPSMPRRTLIITSEELGGHLPGRGDLKDYGAMPEILFQFWSIAREKFPSADIQVYLSTRAQSDWLESAYWQHVKSSSMTLDLDVYLERYQDSGNLEDMIDRIASRVPCPVHSTALEHSRLRPLGPADPLLDLCDIPDALRDTLVPGAAQNVRPDPQTLMALLDVNRTVKDQAKRMATKKAIMAKAGMK